MTTSPRPPEASPEELFLRFRDDGDARALGDLFDRVSPELFRVALALCPDAATAEDALQETWIAALGAADRFDRSRRVVPWLVGILRWKVDRERRLAARAPDPSRVRPPAAAPAPAEDAERREERARVREAIESLPEPYREAALLRWRHGLDPAEIAALKGTAPGTVRSWLHRAAERLRRDLRALAGVLLAPGEREARGLGSVREGVLRRAGTAVPAGTGAATAGGVLMALQAKTVLVSVAVTVLLLAGGLAVLRTVGGETPAGPVPSRGEVAASRPASAPAAVREDGGESGSVEEDSAPDGPAIDLSVVDLAGSPVSGARATLHRHLRDPAARALDLSVEAPARTPALRTSLTGEEGRCVLAVPGEGEFAVVVRAAGFAPFSKTLTLWKGADGRTRVEAVLEKACALEGVVLDATGRPLGRVEVRARSNRPVADPWNGGVATTGEDGRFRMGGLLPVFHWVSVRRGSLLWHSWPAWLPGQGSVTVRLPPGEVAVEGTVVDDATGEPVARVEVRVAIQGGSDHQPLRVTEPQPSSARGRAVSGEDGTFRVEGLPAGRLAAWNCRAEGYLAAPDPLYGFPWTESIPAGETARLEIRLRRGVRVTGTVTDPDGRPLEGARVIAWSFPSADPRGRSVEAVLTGPDGSFRTPAVPSGEGVLVVHAPYPPATGLYQPGVPLFPYENPGPPHSFEIPADADEVRRDERLARGTGTVEGRMLDGEGNPVEGARVGVMMGWNYLGGGGISTSSGRDGTFRIEAVAPGTKLRAVASHGERGLRGGGSPFDLPEGGLVSGQTVVVFPAPVLSGRVVRSDGEPVRGAALYLVPESEAKNGSQQFLDRSLPTPVAPDGSFRFEPGASGPWVLAATAERCAPGWTESLAPTGGIAAEGVIPLGGRDDIVLTLEPAAAVRGRVLDPSGEPIVGARVIADRPTDARGPRMGFPPAFTGADGSFVLGGLPPGPCTLVVHREGAPPHGEDAVAGGPAVEIRLPVFAPIAGRVVDAEGGVPPPPVRVEVRVGDGGPWWTGPAAADGSFESIPLDPAEVYRVRAWGPEGTLQVIREAVGAGTRGLELRLGRAAELRVRLVDGDGKPASAPIQARAVDAGSGPYADTRWTATLVGRVSEGRFLLTVAAGLTYRVVAGGKESGFLPRELEEAYAPGGGEVEIVLARGLSISGTLRDAGAEPAAGTVLQVEAEGLPDDMLPRGTTGEDGRFTLRGLPAAPVRLRAWSPSRREWVDLGTFNPPASALALQLPK